jgi:SAM-dependent methyltransferase
MIDRNYSHVRNFTQYMAWVEHFVSQHVPAKSSILDVPAGNGLLAERLRRRGYYVVCADINHERPDFVLANLEERLPFPDRQFDVVLCLEGIEHVIEPYALIKELCRVAMPDGRIILSLPNVQSYFSRLTFLVAGSLYQFASEDSRHPNGQVIDRGHISPLSLVQLVYLFSEAGWRLEAVRGDRIKRKILLPIYFMLWVTSAVATLAAQRKCKTQEGRDLYQQIRRFRVSASRSIIAVFQRSKDVLC